MTERQAEGPTDTDKQSIAKHAISFNWGIINALVTDVKKSYFGHTFHLTRKKVFFWMGGWLVKSDLNVSLCPFWNF